MKFERGKEFKTGLPYIMFFSSCFDDVVEDFVDFGDFYDWRHSLNYFVIFPYFLKRNDHFLLVHDAYDLYGRVIGTYTAPRKLNETDVRLLIEDAEDFIDWSVGVTFNTIEDARSGEWPTKSVLNRILQALDIKEDYYDWQDENPGEGEVYDGLEEYEESAEWLDTLSGRWSRYIRNSRMLDDSWSSYRSLYYRTFYMIETFDIGDRKKRQDRLEGPKM